MDIPGQTEWGENYLKKRLTQTSLLLIVLVQTLQERIGSFLILFI